MIPVGTLCYIKSDELGLFPETIGATCVVIAHGPFFGLPNRSMRFAVTDCEIEISGKRNWFANYSELIPITPPPQSTPITRDEPLQVPA